MIKVLISLKTMSENKEKLSLFLRQGFCHTGWCAVA